MTVHHTKNLLNTFAGQSATFNNGLCPHYKASCKWPREVNSICLSENVFGGYTFVAWLNLISTLNQQINLLYLATYNSRIKFTSCIWSNYCHKNSTKAVHLRNSFKPVTIRSVLEVMIQKPLTDFEMKS